MLTNGSRNRQATYVLHVTKITLIERRVLFVSFQLIYRQLVDGCPKHPTRVNLSLVFAIRLTGNWFVNPTPLNQHESFPLLLIRHAGSRFARHLKNIGDLGLEGRLKMLSIWWNRHKLFPLLSIWHAGSWFAWHLENIAPLDNVGWVKNVDSIKLTRIVSPAVDVTWQKSICARLRKHSSSGQCRLG